MSEAGRRRRLGGWPGRLDLGDLVGVEGRFNKTKTGELTVFADALHLPGQEPAAAAREVARADRRAEQRLAAANVVPSNPESLATFLEPARR
ncbi:MAG: hypothetical protein U0800_25580 [Isosphaeraceae bacterium]